MHCRSRMFLTAIFHRCQGKGHLRTVHDRKRQRAERKNRQKQRNIDSLRPRSVRTQEYDTPEYEHTGTVRPSNGPGTELWEGSAFRRRDDILRQIEISYPFRRLGTGIGPPARRRPQPPVRSVGHRRRSRLEKTKPGVGEQMFRHPAVRHHGIRTADQNNPFSYFALTFSNISTVMVSRFHVGDHPHSSRAQLSSIESGQLRAMFSLIGSTL